jgi:hypothetical protein
MVAQSVFAKVRVWAINFARWSHVDPLAQSPTPKGVKGVGDETGRAESTPARLGASLGKTSPRKRRPGGPTAEALKHGVAQCGRTIAHR